MSQHAAALTPHEIVDLYCAAWSDPDAVRRKQLLYAACVAHVGYIDPRARTSTADELLEHIAGILARRPGATVARTSAVDEHHGLARFCWHVVDADGAVLLDGLDIVEFAADGKIARVIGFFGGLQAA